MVLYFIYIYFVVDGRFVELRKNIFKKYTRKRSHSLSSEILCAVFYEVPQ